MRSAIISVASSMDNDEMKILCQKSKQLILRKACKMCKQLSDWLIQLELARD